MLKFREVLTFKVEFLGFHFDHFPNKQPHAFSYENCIVYSSKDDEYRLYAALNSQKCLFRLK